MHTSLSQIIRSAAAAQQEQQTNGLRECDVKAWVKMLFSGLRYLHDEARIFHRDITPSNLLVDGSGQLKIGDFGMACSYDYENPSKEYDHRVCTRSAAILLLYILHIWRKHTQMVQGTRAFIWLKVLWSIGRHLGGWMHYGRAVQTETIICRMLRHWPVVPCS